MSSPFNPATKVQRATVVSNMGSQLKSPVGAGEERREESAIEHCLQQRKQGRTWSYGNESNCFINKAPRKYEREIHDSNNNTVAKENQNRLDTRASSNYQQVQQPFYMRSEALKLIREEDEKSKGSSQTIGEQQRPLKQQKQRPDCFVCGRDIIGAMCTSMGVNLHPECFECSTCGAELFDGKSGELQHFLIDEKFYCEVHGRQRKSRGLSDTKSSNTKENKSRSNNNYSALDPDLVVRIPPTAYQPTRPIEPLKGAYQPDMPTPTRESRCNKVPEQKRPKTAAVSPIRESLQSSSFIKNLQSKLELNESSSSSRPQGRNAVNPSWRKRNINAGNTREEGKAAYCNFCKEEINGPYVLATGKTWCPQCFTCANSACARRLLDIGFVEEENGLNYCEKCFETLIAPSCNKCGLPVTSDCLSALKKQWHPDCFVCSHCRKPFGNLSFYLENNLPYCEQGLILDK